MSSSQPRNVRWFGTLVPLISRGVLSIVSLLVALPLSGVLFLYFGYTLLYTNWLIPLLLMLLVGTASHILFLLILNTRFKNPSSNPAFHDMVGRVHQKILVPSSTQVWIRKSNAPFIVSTYNLIFNAVIVSEPMVELMLNRPEASEVLLAFHLARIPRRRWLGDYVGSLILIVILTFLSASFLIPIVAAMITMWQTMGSLIILSLTSSLLPIVILSIFFVIIIRGAFWRHEPAFLRVIEVYGIHPQVAKVEVERGTPLDEEEMQSVIWGVREWEKKKRSSRRFGISVLAAAPTGILSFTIMIMFSGYSYYYNPLVLYAPFGAAFLIGIAIFAFLRRWDKIAMGEVFHETVDSHEPIWMD